MELRTIVNFVSRIHSLDRVPRSGFLLRGVTGPESVAAHSHALAVLTELVCISEPQRFDDRKALAMALIHDLPEVVTMDIPMPAGTERFKSAKVDTERSVFSRLCDGVEALEIIYNMTYGHRIKICVL